MRLHTLIGAAVIAAMVPALGLFPLGAAAIEIAAAPERAGVVGGYLAGLAAQSREDWSAAARYTGDALAASPEDPALRSRAFVFRLAAGDYPGALDAATAARAGGETSPLVTMFLAADAQRRGDGTEAVRLSAELHGDGLGGIIGPLIKGWAEAARNNADAAVQALAPLGQVGGLVGLHDIHVALILDQLGAGDAAEPYFKRALGDNPALQVVRVAADFFRRRGRGDEARRLVDEFNARRPDAAVVDAIIPDRPVVADAAHGSAEAMYDLAGALRREGPGDTSILLARIALFLAPDLAPARMLVGEILGDAERNEEALAEFRQVEGDPVFGWATRLRCADILIELKREDEAVAILETLIAERPDRTAAAVRLGDLRRVQKRWAEAATAYSRVLDRIEDPRDHHWPIFYSRGVSFDNAKDWPRAESDLRTALHLSPDNPTVLNYLGYSWIDRGLNLDEAREMVERAVELRPGDAYIIDSLGWALFKLGDYPGAVAKLERAVERMALDPTVNDHLGDAYFKVGRLDEARFQWERALNNADADTDQDKIRAKLNRGSL